MGWDCNLEAQAEQVSAICCTWGGRIKLFRLKWRYKSMAKVCWNWHDWNCAELETVSSCICTTLKSHHVSLAHLGVRSMLPKNCQLVPVGWQWDQWQDQGLSKNYLCIYWYCGNFGAGVCVVLGKAKKSLPPIHVYVSQVPGRLTEAAVWSFSEACSNEGWIRSRTSLLVAVLQWTKL